MRTAQEIKEFLDNHWFSSRHMAYYIRGFLMTEFPDDKSFEFKYAFSTKFNGKSVDAELITATEAIKFIEDEI